MQGLEAIHEDWQRSFEGAGGVLALLVLLVALNLWRGLGRHRIRA